MAEGMMGRGPARRGRLSDEQRAQIRQVRMEQGRGAARAMRRDMRREAGLPVRQRQRQDGMGDFAPQPAPAAPQSPMVMGQPTGDMMAFRPMPTERPLPPMPAGNPFPQGPTQGVAQGIGAALGGQANNPLRDQMLRFNELSPEARARLIPSRENFFQNANVRDPGFQMNAAQEQAMRDQYTQMPMPQPMPQPMQQEPGYYGSIRRMMNTGRMDANHPMAQTVGAYDRQKAMQMFGQKQAQNAMNPGFNAGLAGARFY